MPIVGKNKPPFPCGHCGKMVYPECRVYKNGKPVWIMPTKYCGMECAAAELSKNLTGKPKVTRGTGKGWVDTSGYKRLSNPEQPHRIIHEHRAVMEKILGRKLRKGETIHHINGIRSDNRPENLELWTRNHGSGIRVADLDIWSGNIASYHFGAL